MCLKKGLDRWLPPPSPSRTGGWKGKKAYQKLTIQGHFPTLALLSDRSGFREVPGGGEDPLEWDGQGGLWSGTGGAPSGLPGSAPGRPGPPPRSPRPGSPWGACSGRMLRARGQRTRKWEKSA